MGLDIQFYNNDNLAPNGVSDLCGFYNILNYGYIGRYFENYGNAPPYYINRASIIANGPCPPPPYLINSMHYEYLNEAVNNAAVGDTIILIRDFEEIQNAILPDYLSLLIPANVTLKMKGQGIQFINNGQLDVAGSLLFEH